MRDGISIGALETATGTPVSTLRFYERKGLLPEPPRVSGRRRYPPEAVDRVLMIRMWQRAGFSIAEITELLARRHRRRAWQGQVLAKLAELETRQAEIQQARQSLEHALLCHAPDWTACAWMRAAARSAAPDQQTPP
jgi:DNA-binding transcriptional MerR regulator